MSADATNQVDTISPPEIHAALARVVESGPLLRSGQLQRLLRFVVEETLAGRGERLKEYVIGVEVFGRPASYDPRLDSLVRVEARRLRAALDAYYRDEGRDDPIVIDFQKGSYLPSFHRAVQRAEAEPLGHPLGWRGRAARPPGTGDDSGRTTGRRSRLAAIAVVAAVIVVAATAVLFLRSRRVTALTERDSILLAGFENTTGEAIFDETLKQGLTVGLEQSPFLNIVPDRRIGQAMQQMGRSAAKRLNEDLAREVCLRAGCRAMIGGSIVRLGSHYVIALTATECATGDAFAHAQEEADSKEAVLTALGRAASDMRGKLGESLASISRFDIPIEEATTRSLEALQAYSLGRKTAREKGSPADIPFYKRAIELDPDFAVAYAALGVSYVNLGQPSMAAGLLERARQLSERASDREKYRILAYYDQVVSGDLEEARDVYDTWKRSYPRDVAPYINLGVAHTWLGEYDKSLAETSEALRIEPANVLSYSNVAALYIKLGRPQEARATLQQALARKLTSKFIRSNLCYLAFLEGDTAIVEQQLAEVRGEPGDEDPLLSQQSDTEAYFGRLRNAREFSGRAVDAALRAGANEAAAGWLVNAALREAEFGEPAEARRYVDRALRLAPGRDVVALAALACARSGDTAQAELLLRDLKKTYPFNTVIRVYWAPTITAAIEIAGGNAGRAIDVLRTALPYELGSPPPIGLATLYPVYVRGEAYLRARDGAAAAREFQKILGHPGLVLNFPLHALAHVQRARALVLAGDIPGARQAYQRFFSLWHEADTGIPLLTRARRESALLR